MLTIMTSKKIRASQGTDPTPQRRHGSGDTNAYAMLLERAFTLRTFEIPIVLAQDDVELR